MIEIKLSGDNALLFLQNEANSSDVIKELETKYSTLVNSYNELQEAYNNLVNAKVPDRLLRDEEIANSANSNPFVKEKKPSVHKYKTRLSKQDKIDLDKLASNKFRSSSKLSQFASHRNLRESTVETYINKHSGGRYKLVHGSEIKSYQVWENANIDTTAMYITMR
jgi:hypothetical protein